MREQYSIRKKRGRNKSWILYSAIAALVMIAAACGVMTFFGWTEPHAVNSAGEIVEEPWVVQAGGQDLFLVESEMDGAEIVAQVKEYYSRGVADLQNVTVEPEISIVRKELHRGEEVPRTIAPELAVREVITKNNGSMPVLTVTTTENTENTRPVKYKVKYQESDMMYEGEENVIRKGRSGEKVITRKIIKVNGDVVKKEVVGEEITKKPVAKIIEKGTMEKPNIIIQEKPAQTGETKPTDSRTEEKGRTEEKQSESASEKSKAGKTRSSDDNGSSGSSRDDDGEDKARDEVREPAGEPVQKPVRKPAVKNPDSGSSTVSPSDGSKGRELASYACRFIGNPYRYGGNSLTRGTDCSGFVNLVYAHFGISVPRTSGQLARYGRPVSYRNAQLGDIVCYPGHVGIYIGRGRIVHASTPSSGIKVSPASYRPVMTVRRVLK